VKPIRGGLLLAVGVVSLLAILPTTSLAAYPGRNGLIAYSEPRGELGVCNYTTIFNGEIFTISPAGGNPTRLTDNAIPDGGPSWSADGRRLAFIRGPGKTCQNPDVWTMRADGGHPHQVTHGPAYDTSPSFSPGGRRILMLHNGNVAIARTDGTKLVKLTRGHKASDPAFSPNGRRIVFARRPRTESPNGIWVMRRDGTHKRLLARADTDAGVEYAHPDFSPDGSHIVFSRCVDEGHQCAIADILMRSNGRYKRALGPGGGEAPVFSPDGARIAAVVQSCDYLENCTWSIVSFARDGSDVRTVRQAQGQPALVGSPGWQPIPGG
jgi:Tol biopolymer transport system component